MVMEISVNPESVAASTQEQAQVVDPAVTALLTRGLPNAAAVQAQMPVVERRVAADSKLVELLGKEFGIADARLAFVYGAHESGRGAMKHVLYVSDDDMRVADLQGPVVSSNTRVQVVPGDLMKAVYMTREPHYCIYINGVPYWF